MKMNLQNRNRAASQKKQWIWYAGFFCVLVILFPAFWLQIFYDISVPFIFVKNSISSGFQSNSSLALQNEELKTDITHLDTVLLSMQALQSENDSLTNMIGHAVESSPKKTIIASVLSAPPLSPYDTLIIQAGQKDNIAIGNPVFADDGTPIGTIAEVYASFSKVSLYSSPGTSLSVVVGKNNLHENALGEGGGEFSMKIPVALVPQGGDAVYLPQFSPAALGRVSRVSFAPSDSFATVLFSFPVNLFTLSYVTIDTSMTSNTYATSTY